MGASSAGSILIGSVAEGAMVGCTMDLRLLILLLREAPSYRRGSSTDVKYETR